MEKYKYEQLTGEIIGLCIRVHSKLGPGLLERVYEEALCKELKKAKISFARQVDIPVVYDDEDLGIGYRADLIIEDTVILELKSIEEVLKVRHKVLMTYMRLGGYEVGLLINFNEELLKQGITRILDDEWQNKYGKK